jgi:predicted glutamine amidotransferase
MCRLFGLHAGSVAVPATFWLLDAPDSLAAQSRQNPDGAGIGIFDQAGHAVVDKQPMAAWDDPDFASGARDLRSRTFVAHVRYASTGSHVRANTHPFEQRGRLFAHNGVVQGLSELDARLAGLGASDLVGGDTDSERMFALITAETAEAGGDVAAGITSAVSWLAEHVPVYSLNFVLTTPSDLWALRYPANNELHILEHGMGDRDGRFEQSSDRIHARSEELTGRPWVVIASEQMDDDPAWRPIRSGELVHVDADLAVHTAVVAHRDPQRLLTRGDLDAHAAQSQQPAVA